MHSCTFYIHSYEVDIWVEFGQSDGIFTLAAAQFEHYRVLVVKIVLVPVSFHFERNVLDYGVGVLENVAERFHLGKLL